MPKAVMERGGRAARRVWSWPDCAARSAAGNPVDLMREVMGRWPSPDNPQRQRTAIAAAASDRSKQE